MPHYLTCPIFRLEDWICYQKVNELFAEHYRLDCHEESPLVLIQDYHLALLPFLVKKSVRMQKLPFFGISPGPTRNLSASVHGDRRFLFGCLGRTSSFHIEFFCNNFLDTVDTSWIPD